VAVPAVVPGPVGPAVAGTSTRSIPEVPLREMGAN